MSDRNKKPSLKQFLFRKAFNHIYEDIENTVVPRTEEFIVDLFSATVSGITNMIIGAFENLIYRDRDVGPSSSSFGEPSYLQYYNRGKRAAIPEKKKKSRVNTAGGFTDGLISCRSWDEIYYDNHDSAQRLVNQIKRDALEHNGISVSELYEYLDKTGGDFTNNYYGWRDLSKTRVVPNGHRQYWIRFDSKPIDLK